MADLTHLFKVGQIVKCRLDGDAYTGTVKETYTDHIIVDIPDVSDHCWFESGFNIGDVQPVYEILNGGKILWSQKKWLRRVLNLKKNSIENEYAGIAVFIVALLS